MAAWPGGGSSHRSQYQRKMRARPQIVAAAVDRRKALIRRCDNGDVAAIRTIINAAADAYKGVIPADRWHEPYMPEAELRHEIEAGVGFWGYLEDGRLRGVMGIQQVRDVTLIRHAYVAPADQRRGIGGALLNRVRGETTLPILIGTWAAAEWAPAPWNLGRDTRR